MKNYNSSIFTLYRRNHVGPAPDAAVDVDIKDETWEDSGNVGKILLGKLTKLKRPFILDILFWITVSVFCICFSAAGPYMSVTAAFVVLLDLSQFCYCIIVRRDKRHGFKMHAYVISIFCLLWGFPFGTAAKVAFCLWNDGYFPQVLSIGNIFVLYSWIFGIGAYICIVFFALFVVLKIIKCFKEDVTMKTIGLMFIAGIQLMCFSGSAFILMVLTDPEKDRSDYTGPFGSFPMNILNKKSQFFVNVCPWTFSFTPFWVFITVLWYVGVYVTTVFGK